MKLHDSFNRLIFTYQFCVKHYATEGIKTRDRTKLPGACNIEGKMAFIPKPQIICIKKIH